MSNPNQICLMPEAGDTGSFGSYVAINDKYLTVGDPGANRVVIYTIDNTTGQWSRDREIQPPVDAAFNRKDSLFGNGLELDEDVLTISARIRNPEGSRNDLSPSQAANTPPTYSYRRYLINLKTETQVRPIELLVRREPESNLVRFNLLRQGKIEQFILPDMGEEHFGNYHGADSFYGSNVVLYRNLLLVGYLSSFDNTGGAWLFDLERPQDEPLKLAIEDTALGRTVAISQKFAAIGPNGRCWYVPQGNIHDKSYKPSFY
ncbi:MAG TPA: hypothetical protein ACFCUY_13955 [Xenococcaceae cyanobacterium]